jgi:hypothetical protein
VGPRALRIRRPDLADLLTPAASKEAGPSREIRSNLVNTEVLAPSATQVERRLTAIEAARTLRQQMLARRDGRMLSPSWHLIREARAKRSARR